MNPNLQQQQQPLLASSTSTSSQSHGQTTSTTAEEANKHDDISMKDTDESLPRVRTYKTSLESNFNRINDLVITNNGKILITLNDHQLHFYTVPDTLGEKQLHVVSVTSISKDVLHLVQFLIMVNIY